MRDIGHSVKRVPEEALNEGKFSKEGRSFDVQKIDTDKIEQFLRSGKKEECRDVLRSFFEGVGYSQLNSMMMRLYITMDIYICARSFTKELNVPFEEFTRLFGKMDDIEQRLTNSMSTFDFFSGMLEQCIEWRKKFSYKDDNAIIEKAKEYIAQNYNQEWMSLKNVADEINLSHTYFSSSFKKSVGVNFVDYLTKLRLDKAKEMLCCTSMKVSEIAYMVGFKDYRYFSQVFKKCTNQTPREFKYTSKKH